MLYRKLTLVEFEPKKIRLLKNTLSALAADVLHLCLLGGILARIFPAFSRSLRIQSECAARKCGKNADQKTSKYGLFLRSVVVASNQIPDHT